MRVDGSQVDEHNPGTVIVVGGVQVEPVVTPPILDSEGQVIVVTVENTVDVTQVSTPKTWVMLVP